MVIFLMVKPGRGHTGASRLQRRARSHSSLPNPVTIRRPFGQDLLIGEKTPSPYVRLGGPRTECQFTECAALYLSEPSSWRPERMDNKARLKGQQRLAKNPAQLVLQELFRGGEVRHQAPSMGERIDDFC